MKFIIGIGNPGKQYEKTRHNIGFRVIDSIEKAMKNEELKIKNLRLVKPSTYVNCTGDEVAAILKKSNGSLDDFLIVCDDVNLAFGKMRLRAKGSSGGHNGLGSVMDALGTEDFTRLRIGVKNETTSKNLAPFVLESFSKKEEKELKPVLERAVLVCKAWAEKGFSAAQNEISLKRENV